MDAQSAVQFSPFFSGIFPEDCKQISAVAHVQEFAHHETLYRQGEPVRQVFLLTSGFVKSTQLGPKGTEVILRVTEPGDVLGAASLWATGRHTTTTQALRRASALVWEARVFQFLAEAFPVALQNMIRLTGERLQELEKRFLELATERVARRLARQLVRLQEQAGRHVNDSIEIRLSRKDLAQMTGTTLFTVSRLLRIWVARGVVNLRRDSVTVCDIESLHKLSE